MLAIERRKDGQAPGQVRLVMGRQVQAVHAPLQELLLAPFRWLISVKLMGILAILLCLLQRFEPLALLDC